MVLATQSPELRSNGYRSALPVANAGGVTTLAVEFPNQPHRSVRDIVIQR